MQAQRWDGERTQGSGRSIRAAWWNMSEAAQRPQTTRRTSPASAVWRRLRRACWGNSSGRSEPLGPKWFCQWFLQKPIRGARSDMETLKNLHLTEKVCRFIIWMRTSHPFFFFFSKTLFSPSCPELPWRSLTVGIKSVTGSEEEHTHHVRVWHGPETRHVDVCPHFCHALCRETQQETGNSWAVFGAAKPIVCVHEGKSLSADI